MAVNQETAEFLLAFSAPSSLLSAVQLISKRVAAAPDAILEEIYPTPRTFLDRGLLVRLGNTRQGTGVRRIGAWTLERPINDFDDSSVFLVKNADRFYLFNEAGVLIVAKLSPKGYEEVSRAKILEPTGRAFKRDVVWSHPAFANRCMFARNDKELVCVSLSEK